MKSLNKAILFLLIPMVMSLSGCDLLFNAESIEKQNSSTNISSDSSEESISYKSVDVNTDDYIEAHYTLEGYNDPNTGYQGYKITGYKHNKKESPDIVVPKEYNGRRIIAISSFSSDSTVPITSVYVHESIIYISTTCVEKCPNFNSFIVDENNEHYTSINGALYSKDETTLIKCPTARTGRFVIPDNVTTIGDQAFIFCSKLTSIVFHENVNYVGLDNFYGCSSLENVNLPNNMTSIPETLFANCASLTSITIPDNVESINYRGFSDCKGLKEVVIPNKVKSIAAFAFGGCTSLTTITFKGTKEEWNSIEKDETWNIEVPATTVHCSDGDINID